MSYAFDAGNENINGTFGAAFDFPITLACYVYLDPSHPNVTTYLLAAGLNGFTSINSSAWIRTETASSVDRMSGSLHDSAGTVMNAGTPSRANLTDLSMNAVWVPCIVVILGSGGVASAATIYTSLGNGSTVSGTGDCGSTTPFAYFRIGESMSAGGDFGSAMGALPGTGYIAEPAIWNSALDATQRSNYLDGTSAYLIDNSNLKFYNPLRDGTPNSDALHVGPTLTISGATYAASHPTINYSTSTPIAALSRNYQSLVWS